MKKILIAVFSFLSILGCKTVEEENREGNTSSSTLAGEGQLIHNSRNSLDWNGTYTGVLPCMDCPGIETLLVINEDLTYTLEQKKIETAENESTEFKTTGNFSWNEQGNIISVGTLEGELELKVEELFLVPVDPNGFEVKPEPGNNFKLLKQ